MSDHANDATPTIGPVTEARLQLAFANARGCLLTAKATADLLGMDQGTLRMMAEQGLITCVRRGTGSIRAYREGDIRLFLTQGPAPERPTAPKTSQSATTKVVSFMERRRAKRAS